MHGLTRRSRVAVRDRLGNCVVLAPKILEILSVFGRSPFGEMNAPTRDNDGTEETEEGREIRVLRCGADADVEVEIDLDGGITFGDGLRKTSGYRSQVHEVSFSTPRGGKSGGFDLDADTEFQNLDHLMD